MVVGENFYCIKTRINRDSKQIINQAGKTYKVISINYKFNNGVVYIENEINDDTYYYSINYNHQLYNLNVYFIDIKKMRKDKLKKLYESSL